MISENSEWIELIPAGTFSTNDGRGPFNNPDPQAVVRLSIQYMKAKGGGVPIDIEHATDRAAPHGSPAPAAGWVRDFRVVAGAVQGRVEWTPSGAAALRAKEYRFISPVFTFIPPDGAPADATTGQVMLIQRAALTNNPALDQLPALAASQTVQLSADEKKICAMLGNSEADYAAAKARRQRLYGTRTAPAPATSILDAEIERQVGPMLRQVTALVNAVNAQAEGTPVAAEMSEEDKKFCWLMGVSPAALIATRKKHEQAVLAMRSEDTSPVRADADRGGGFVWREKMSQRIFNGVALTDDELAVCNAFGTDPAVFAARLADRRAGRPMILSSQSRKENPTGVIGPTIVDEAFEEHRQEMESPSIDHRQLIQEARNALDEFDRKAAAPDAWKILARATAMLVGALDRIGPAYVDRVNPQANIPGKAQSQWK